MRAPVAAESGARFCPQSDASESVPCVRPPRTIRLGAAATCRNIRVDAAETGRGDAAAASWIIRGDGSRGVGVTVVGVSVGVSVGIAVVVVAY